MILIGRYLSPHVRRCGVTLRVYGMTYEHRPLRTWVETAEVRAANPLGRVPSLILDDGKTLVDSAVIIDALDHMVSADKALTPRDGVERWQIMSLAALASGAAEKAVVAEYERAYRPADKRDESRIEHCEGQTKDGLEAIDRMAKMPWIAGERMSQADVTAVVAWEFVGATNPALAERINCPNLKDIAARIADTPPFAETRPEV